MRRRRPGFVAPLTSGLAVTVGFGGELFSAALAGVIGLEMHIPSIATAATRDHLQRLPLARGSSDTNRSIVRAMGVPFDRGMCPAAIQVLELIALVGFYHTVSFVANGLRLPAEPAGRRTPRGRPIRMRETRT
jgi:hypothetical protein